MLAAPEVAPKVTPKVTPKVALVIGDLMDIHTDALDKHPESVIFFYRMNRFRQKAVPFFQNPAVYEKNAAGYEQKAPPFGTE